MDSKTLRDAEVGKYYVVKKINGRGPLKRRIMDMGITKNSEIYITKVAPLGDPVQINIRNYEMSIRREDAELIEIEEIKKEANK
ncbi:ferrous iron transport protein A [Peptoniphilus sp. MSJ-1]|uniref:Ferrous iron transport protein A n=1 Tax=Peptoniphilus ovalis TaxID=2841503 RepID=A0ABS6FGT3_9FIRM|nr:ferrous iron transport protein A [Peptoniphilus ovalis]MBU5668747.1 ferrous iron transport protein A [Peptoniphilus ovalis]